MSLKDAHMSIFTLITILQVQFYFESFCFYTVRHEIMTSSTNTITFTDVMIKLYSNVSVRGDRNSSFGRRGRQSDRTPCDSR